MAQSISRAKHLTLTKPMCSRYGCRESGTLPHSACRWFPGFPGPHKKRYPNFYKQCLRCGEGWNRRFYHCEDDRYYGKTKQGEYLSEADAVAKGARPSHGKACAK